VGIDTRVAPADAGKGGHRTTGATRLEPMNERSLKISAYEEPGRYVLTLGGELDLAGAPAFEDAAARLCEMGARELLVDISDVGFIDSTGIRAILGVKASCEARSCEFSMTHGRENVDHLFELTRLIDRLTFRTRRREPARREIAL
jgi:anti-sigma B factor antagonist